MLMCIWFRMLIICVNVKVTLSLDNQTDLNKTDDNEHINIDIEENNRRARRALEGRVVGGDYTEITSYPHSVFLQAYCSGSESYWICGSSVINQRMLLTAGHCVYGCYKNFRMSAIAGTASVDRVNVMRSVRRYIIHEKYDHYTDFADIALVMLNANLPLGTTIRKVIIRPSFPSNSRGYVAGWGVINEAYQETNYLKQVVQMVRPRYECKHLHLKHGMMCVTSGTTKDYPAVGDSGSALITNEFQQIGIVSFKSSKKARQMIVYTNVSYFYSWIVKRSVMLYCRS